MVFVENILRLVFYSMLFLIVTIYALAIFQFSILFLLVSFQVFFTGLILWAKFVLFLTPKWSVFQFTKTNFVWLGKIE
jgi:hypothetical protein